MKKSPLLIKMLVLIGILGVCIFIFSPKHPAFKLVSSSPTDKSSSFNPDESLVLNFSNIIDPESPYETFSISPRVEGRVEVEDTRLVFIPETGFSDTTTYSATIRDIHAVDGTTISISDFSFTTAARKKSSFEQSLPYDGGDFMVDRLADGTIIVIIINPPAAANKEKALDFLRSQKIDTTNVGVQIAASAQ